MAEIIERVATLETKVDSLEHDISCLNKIEISIARMTTLLEMEVQKGEKRDRIIEQQSETLANQNITLVKVNDNLDNLNRYNKDIKEDIIELKNDVYKKFDNLENQFDQSEEKSKVDIRDIEKENVTKSFGEKVKGIVFPTGGIAGFASLLYEILKAFKIIQ